MLFPREILSFRQEAGVGAIQTVLECFLNGPGLRTVEKDRLDTCFKELPFKCCRNLRVPDLLQFYTGSPGHAFPGVEILSAVCYIGT